MGAEVARAGVTRCRERVASGCAWGCGYPVVRAGLVRGVGRGAPCGFFRVYGRGAGWGFGGGRDGGLVLAYQVVACSGVVSCLLDLGGWGRAAARCWVVGFGMEGGKRVG